MSNNITKKPQSEKSYENKIKRYLKTLPKCWFFKVRGNMFQKAGVPDIIGVLNGRFIAIEVKSEVGKPSELQLATIKLIKRAGGYAVVSGPKHWDELKKDLEGISGGSS